MADNEEMNEVLTNSEQEAAREAFKVWKQLHGWLTDRFVPKRELNRHGGQMAVVLETKNAWTRLRKDDHDPENPALDLEISEPGKGKRTIHFKFPKGKGRK